MKLKISDQALEHLQRKGGAVALDYIGPLT